MNDSLKRNYKGSHKGLFFIITVAMLFVVSLANSIALIEYYPPLFSVGCNGNRCGNFNSDSAFLL